MYMDYDLYDHWDTCACGYKAFIQGHSFGYWVIDTPATQTTDGSKSRQCNSCDYVEHTVIPADHTCIPSDWIVDVVATSRSDGSKHKECTICGEMLETAVIRKTGMGHEHSYSEEWKKDEANHWKECQCGHKIYLRAHSFGNWIIDVEATETTEGSRHRECVSCGYKTESYAIPVLGSNINPLELIDGSFFVIDGDYVFIRAEMTLAEIAAQFKGTVDVSGVGTGATVSAGGESLTIIAMGDVNGDGKVNARDYLLAKRAFLKSATLTAPEERAVLVSGSSAPSSRDYLVIKRHYLGTYDIYGIAS